MNSALAMQPAYDRQRPPRRDALLLAIVLQADISQTRPVLKTKDASSEVHYKRLVVEICEEKYEDKGKNPRYHKT